MKLSPFSGATSQANSEHVLWPLDSLGDGFFIQNQNPKGFGELQVIVHLPNDDQGNPQDDQVVILPDRGDFVDDSRIPANLSLGVRGPNTANRFCAYRTQSDS